MHTLSVYVSYRPNGARNVRLWQDSYNTMYRSLPSWQQTTEDWTKLQDSALYVSVNFIVHSCIGFLFDLIFHTSVSLTFYSKHCIDCLIVFAQLNFIWSKTLHQTHVLMILRSCTYLIIVFVCLVWTTSWSEICAYKINVGFWFQRKENVQSISRVAKVSKRGTRLCKKEIPNNKDFDLLKSLCRGIFGEIHSPKYK